MKLENDYPKIKNKVNKFVKVRKILLILFLISIVTCVIVNISVGGKKWSLYVILAEVMFYYAFLNRPLLSNSLIKRLTVVLLIICAYLYMIDLIEKTSWSYFVINILLFSTLLLQILLFFTEFRNKKKEFVPLFITSICSVIFCILAVAKVFELNWAVIVFGSLGLASIIMLFSFYRKYIISELKKYFSIK